jgi:hypothetical protein
MTQPFLWSSTLKTKKVAGVDLSERCFAYIGNPYDTSTWKLPLFFPGDPKKTVNHICDALGRFEQTKSIPDERREIVRHTIVGAAKAHGIKVENSFSRPATKTQPTEAETAMQRELKKLKAELGGMEAIEDFRADAFLKALGLE